MPSSEGYFLAYQLALEKLGQMDIEEVCRKSGARSGGSQKIIVEYLNRSYLVSLPDSEVILRDSEEPVPLKDKILILHYLTRAEGTSPTNRLIGYQQLTGGTAYFAAFSQRSLMPLVNRFGKDPSQLIDAAARLGGHQAGYGDAAVTINAFSQVPITIALWQGDDEVPSRGNILFDRNISHYLPTEDIAVLCETIVWGLIRGV